MHPHPGTFLLSLYNRSFGTCPSHQFDGSWTGKWNVVPILCFLESLPFAKCERGSGQGVLRIYVSVAWGVPFSTELYKVLLALTVLHLAGSRTGWHWIC